LAESVKEATTLSTVILPSSAPSLSLAPPLNFLTVKTMIVTTETIAKILNKKKEAAIRKVTRAIAI